MSDGTMSKVLGGTPLGVFARLVLVSILVGVILSALGLDPFDIVRSIQRMIRTLWDLGFDAFRWLIEKFQPRYHLHGHVHVYDRRSTCMTQIGKTQVVNVYPYREITLELD